MHNHGIYVQGDMNVSDGKVVNVVDNQRSRRRSGVDVLVITALKEEHEAARAVTGLSQWKEHGAGGPTPFASARYRTETGWMMSVAIARPNRMGGRSTGPIVTTLTDELKPTCLAMCGVCAGNPGATAPGDVVVAAPAYEWDEGKHTVSSFQADPQQFPQDSRWVRSIQDFDPSGLPTHGLATDVEAEVWYLERLYRGQNPRKHPARPRYFPPSSWATRLGVLESKGLIAWRDGGWALTDSGRNRIERILYDAVDGPDKLPFAVHVGPMASGSAVMTDGNVWDRLEVGQRSILAVEMEAATIATVAHERQVPHWLIAKGVMDHADPDKDDRYKAFAARSSAEVLFALLTRLLSPVPATARSTSPRGRIPEPVKLEIARRLTYDWQDLADVVGVPSYETRRFRAGDEPRELWAWLENRGRLAEMPAALDDIGRTDLAALLRPYV